MSDPKIREGILIALWANGGVTAPNDGAFREATGLVEYSNNAVQAALGRLIKDGLVVRTRRPIESIYGAHEDRPCTYVLTTEGEATFMRPFLELTLEQDLLMAFSLWVYTSKRKRQVVGLRALRERLGAWNFSLDALRRAIEVAEEHRLFRVTRLQGGGFVFQP